MYRYIYKRKTGARNFAQTRNYLPCLMSHWNFNIPPAAKVGKSKQLSTESSSYDYRFKSGANHLTDFIGVEPSKKRKRRTSFTPQALELLNAHFDRNTHPSGKSINANYLSHASSYSGSLGSFYFHTNLEYLFIFKIRFPLFNAIALSAISAFLHALSKNYENTSKAISLSAAFFVYYLLQSSG